MKGGVAVAYTHPCPYCGSTETLPTLKEPGQQYYLCKACRSAFGVFDASPDRADVTDADGDEERDAD
jgi:transposase-like protein